MIAWSYQQTLSGDRSLVAIRSYPFAHKIPGSLTALKRSLNSKEPFPQLCKRHSPIGSMPFQRAQKTLNFQGPTTSHLPSKCICPHQKHYSLSPSVEFVSDNIIFLFMPKKFFFQPQYASIQVICSLSYKNSSGYSLINFFSSEYFLTVHTLSCRNNVIRACAR
jgi:hypothetical protein